MGSMGEEMQVLRTRAEDAVRLESELKEATTNTARLEGLYQVEQVGFLFMLICKSHLQVLPICGPVQPEIKRIPCPSTLLLHTKQDAENVSAVKERDEAS